MISMPHLRTAEILIAIATAVLLQTCFTSILFAAQKPDPKKYQHAVHRSQDAGRIVTLLAVAPDGGLAKEIVDRAEAIGVFPKVEKETVMFNQITKGYGVISARSEKGWTLPAFYQFGGGGYGNPFASKETYAVILLFMNKDSLKWFEKGAVALTNQQKAIEGPVGPVTEAQLKELEGVPVIAYAYYNGKVNGKGFGTGFWKSFFLNPDNNINKPVYGIKGREVLAGARLDATTVIPGIPEYQEALTRYYSR